MEIEHFIERIEEEFEDLPGGVLKPTSDFKKVLDWNSINALVMISLSDAEYEVIVNAKDLNNAQSLHDLLELVKKKRTV